MAKEEKLVLKGKVIEALPRGFFRVAITFDEGAISQVTATLAGKLRTSNIRVLVGDEVDVEITPYDLTKGRITYRHTGSKKILVDEPVKEILPEVPQTEVLDSSSVA